MQKKNQPAPAAPSKQDDKPVLLPPVDPDEPFVPDTNDPDIIPDNEEFETPPYEAPEPGEGP